MNLSRLSIRARITGGSLLIAVLISVVAGIVIFDRVRHIVADGQAALLENVEAPYLTALSENPPEGIDEPGPDQLVAVVDPLGAAKVNTLPAALSAELDVLLTRSGETRTVIADSTSYLVRVTAVATSGGSWHVITANRDDAQASVLNQVAVLLVASIAGINLAFGVASWFIGTAALTPVSRLRRSAAALVSRSGEELLPVGPAHDEIAELASTLNELIGQLRASAERERQIVSDASHEFRTPLAIIQTQLELAQAEASSLEQMQTDVRAAQGTLARLSALATSMLELSRIDAQAAPGQATFTELAAELADAADRGRQRVGGRDILIDYSTDVEGPRLARVGAADFGRVCDNLVNNALAAMGARGVVELALTADDDYVQLLVRDDAGGMDDDFLPFALDRFSRASSSRSGVGAGLGLPIVAGIAAVAGGDVVLDNRAGAGLVVAVRFPVAETSGEAGWPDDDLPGQE